MRKLAIVISIAATALMVPAAAKAAPPSAVSGTETFTGATATVVRTAGGNTIIANTLTGIIAGSFTGTFTADFTTIAHSSGQANDVHGTFICTCSIAGRSGSVTFRFEGTGTPSATELHGETIGATGGLQGLHSNVTVDIVGAAVGQRGPLEWAPMVRRLRPRRAGRGSVPDDARDATALEALAALEEVEFDHEGRCTKSAGEDGLFSVALKYFPFEGRTEVTQADGSIWQYLYDTNKSITSIVDSDGATRTFRFRPDGQIDVEVDPAGREIHHVYTGEGRLVGKRDGSLELLSSKI